MKKLSVLIPSWKSADLLKVCLPSLQESFTEDSEVIVILNEADDDSIAVCRENKVKFISLDKNYGPMAVDFAKPFIEKSEYVGNWNTDMIAVPGFDKELCGIIDRNYPTTASCFLVEPHDTGGNPIVKTDNLGEFTNPNTKIQFLENYKNGKYRFPSPIISYTHPIVCRSSDFLKIGGYSNNFDMRYLSGYGLDNLFPWKLKQLNKDYKFITSNVFCVYHGISLTNRKLAPEIKNRSGWGEFIQDTGTNWQQFNAEINIFSPISIN